MQHQPTFYPRAAFAVASPPPTRQHASSMAQVLQMQAAPELGKAQFDQNMNMDAPRDRDRDGDREPATPASPDSAETRGRRRDREDSGDDGADGETGGSRKRRRSRKGLDKKFECPHEDCGKSYSRAEHLYRHQLNRTSSALQLRMLGLRYDLRVLTRCRQSQADLQLRLPRLPQVQPAATQNRDLY